MRKRQKIKKIEEYNKMEVSTLFKIKTIDLTSEAEVETRFLPKLFHDLGYSDKDVIPKKRLPNLSVNDGSKRSMGKVFFITTPQK